ncbi:MAG: fasciclin domain-containing protein [Cytophagales bacterium]|nr:fasciclin domain-containing protein [Cytophagales bacterium]
MSRFYRLLFLVFVFFAASLWSCRDEFDEYYEKPDWLKGTTIETLEARGDCTFFVEGLRKTGLDLPVTQSTTSAFVPTDNVFKAYLKRKGYSSLDDIPKEDLKNLIGNHLLLAPYSRFQIFNSPSWGGWEEVGAKVFKKSTMATRPIVETAEIEGVETKVVNFNKVVSIFGDEFLEAAGYDKSDYEYFNKGKKWSGFHYGNASVLEQEIPINNGFLYIIDDVVEPQPSIEEFLASNKDYSLFKSLYDRFIEYNITTLDLFLQINGLEKETPVSLKGYGSLANIATEVPTDSWSTGFNNQLGEAGFKNHSAFIPNNDALQSYLNETMLKDGRKLEDVPDKVISYLLKGHILNSGISLPSVIRKNGFFNGFGEEVSLDVDNDVEIARIGSNGFIYGLKKVLAPNIYTSVAGNLLFDEKYSMFSTFMDMTGNLTTLSSADADFSVFAVSDEVMTAAGYRFITNEDKQLVMQQKDQETGDYKEIPSSKVVELAQQYISFVDMKDKTDNRIVQSIGPEYIRMNGDKVSLGGNEEQGARVNVVTKETGGNGTLYELDGLLKKSTKTWMEQLSGMEEYSEFYTLLRRVRLVGYNSNTKLFTSQFADNVTVFAPNNKAVQTVKDKLPLEGVPEVSDNVKEDLPALTEEEWTASRKLIQLLKYHFVDGNVYSVSPDLKQTEKSYTTQRINQELSDEYETVYEKVSILTGAGSLKITDRLGKTYNATGDIFATDGVIQKVGGMLWSEKVSESNL